ncbi:beta strand repeat-containing protein [Salipiger abyssi]|uniref:beta strand repeat-containing protein n=1 Tax=Salipiger abyssi TaxID=1250539 RepID=UPI00405919E0
MVYAISDESRLNIFTQSNQNNVTLAALAGGGYVAVWQSNGQNGSGTGLTAQLLTEFGEPTGLPFFIETDTLGNQVIGDVAGTADGGFVVTWEGDGATEILARQFDATGTPVTAEFQVNSETYSTQISPNAAALSGGGYVIAWASYNDETYTYDIRAQRFDASGAPAGAEFTVNTTLTNGQYAPEITALNGGGFVVVWEDRSGADGSGYGIFAQRYNAAGVAQGGETQINTTNTTGTQTEPDVMALTGGGFVVVWTDQNGADGSVYGIYGQILDASGAPVGGEFQINQSTASYQWQPSVTATSDGGFFVTYSSYTSPAPGSPYDILGRHFDSTGTATGDEVVVTQDGAGNLPEHPDSVMLSSGAIVVAWDYPASAGDGSGDAVYQRLFALDGETVALPVSPILEGVDPAITFTEAQIQAAPQILDLSGAVAVSGPADFDGGRLTVSRITARGDTTPYSSALGYEDDILGLRDQGTGAGQIGLSGTTVSFGGTAIGTIVSDGTLGAPLEIVFNSNATPQAVEALVENLTYANPSDDPIAQTLLAIRIEDGDGGTSDAAVIDVTVLPETDATAPVFETEMQVNTYTASTQRNPTVAALSDGGWVVMWESYGQDSRIQVDYGIIGQRYDSHGAAIGPEFLVTTQLLNSQTAVDVAAITGGAHAGGFVATWYDAANGSEGYVRAQIFDASGARVGGEIAVPSSTYSTQSEARVESFADGSFAIVWSANHSGSGTDVMLRLFDASGSPIGGESFVSTTTANAQSTPDIAALAGGGFAVTWSGDDAGTATREIFARLFDASGAAVSAEIAVNSATAGQQNAPAIVGLTGGGFVVVWTDESGLDGSLWGTYGQIFAANGTPVGTQFLINELTGSYQYQPEITALPGGGFSVVFSSTASAYNGYDVLMQTYDAAGNRIDGETRVSQLPQGTQENPSLATLANGDVIVVFEDQNGTDGSGTGIFQQIMGDPAHYPPADANPRISIAEHAVTLTEADVNAGPRLLFEGVDVGDADSTDFDGGRLTVYVADIAGAGSQFSAPDDFSQDQIGIRDQGTGAGQIGVSGNSVTYGGAVIGTIAPVSASGVQLTVDLTAAATPQAVEALLQNVTYANPSDDPEATRTVRVMLTDGDGGVSNPTDISVTLTPELDGFAAAAPEQQVNSFSYGNQTAPGIATLNTGDYVVVWSSYDQDAGSNDDGIYAQRFDATGQALGEEFQVNTTTASSQSDADIAPIAAADGGGFVVVWRDTDSSAAGEIMAQVLNDDGTPRGTEFQVETNTSSTQYQPAVAQVAGGFIVAWASYESGSYNIKAQFFDGSGSALGAEFSVASTAGTERLPAIATGPSGEILIAWQDETTNDVHAQRIDGSGAAIGSAFQLNETAAGRQYLPQVTYLSDGRIVAVWTDQSGLDGYGYGVFARLFAADGTPLGGEFLVAEDVNGNEYGIDVMALSDGGFAISYDGANDASGGGAFAQIYNADGSRRDGPLQLNEETSSTQYGPVLTEVSDGTDAGLAAAWVSSNSGSAGDGSGYGIFTRVFGPEGSFQPANLAPVLDNLDAIADFGVADVTSPMLIDNAVELSDADSADFDGGAVTLRYLDHQAGADAQLSIIAGRGISVSGSDILYDGTVIGTVDATDNGVNGADLVISLNANANAANIQILIERLGYSSTAPVVGVDRSVSLRISDGDGGLSAGESIRLEIESATPALGNSLAEIDDAYATESQVEAGLRLDPSIEFNYDLGNGFDGGYVEISYRTTTRGTTAFETLSVADIGTGTNQIGISGTDITFGGVVIGSIDATANGQSGADLRVNLVAAATPDAITALIEALTYSNSSDGPPEQVNLEIEVRDAANSGTGSPDFELYITRENDGGAQPLGDAAQVNAFSTGDQQNAAITELADGGFVVTWQSYNQDSASGYDWGIYQQRYDAEGQPVGPEELVNETTAGSQSDPHVNALGTGGWVTVWESNDNSGSGIWARIHDASGVPGAEFQVNVQTSSTQQLPRVTALSNGNFVVAWESATSGSAGDGNGYGIVARIFSATGTPLGAGDLILNSLTTGSQQDVDLVALSGGGFVAVWESNGVDGDGYGIAFQRFDNSGSPLGGETVVNTTATGHQRNPSVGALADGGFVVVWDSPDGSGDGVFMQRFSATGSTVGGEVQVSDWQPASQYQADVTGTTDGGWIVTFYDGDYRGTGSYNVYAQRYAPDGSRIDSNTRVNAATDGTQSDPAIAALSDGRVAIAYTSTSSGSAGDGSANGVFLTLMGDPAETQSVAPNLAPIADVTLGEAAINAGAAALFLPGSIAISDSDSVDFDGGRLMVHVVRVNAATAQFASPDDFSQDVFGLQGSGISVSGGVVSVDGIVVGNLLRDGQSGAGLEIALTAGATPERIETLLGGLTYANSSNDPSALREVEITLSDGDGGVLEHTTFEVIITPETDGFEMIGGEAQVNSFIANTQNAPAVAGLAGGSYVVVWQSYNQDNPGDNDYGIIAQLMDPSGQPIGPELVVNTTVAASQVAPDVVALSDGGFVVAWSGTGLIDGNGTFAQRFDATGAAVGSEFRLNDTVSGGQDSVALAAVPSGGLIAVWRNYSTSEIEARLFDASGAALGSEFAVSTTLGGVLDPEVIALSGGGFVVGWNLGDTLYAQRLDATGTPVGTEFTVSTGGAGTISDAQLAALSGGGFAVAWTESGGQDGNGWGIYAATYDAAGNVQTAPFLVNEYVNSTQNEPAISATADGGFVVTFRDNSAALDTSGYGIVAQQFDANGNRIDGSLLVNEETSGSQTQPAVALLASGALAFAWTSPSSGTAGDGSGDGVFSRILGDPAAFAPEDRPVLQGLNDAVAMTELALNIGPQLIDANAAVALSDNDSSDFDGGFLRVDMVRDSLAYDHQVAPPDNSAQDNLGLRQAQGITVSGGAVSVGGTVVGQITESGVAGAPFEITFNANASVAAVELLIENLTYRNSSDAPESSRIVRVQVGDGDDGASDPAFVTINIAPQTDGATPLAGERQANTTTASHQSESDVARLDDGGFVIVWQGWDSTDSTYSIFGQRFDANGNPVDTEFLVNTDVTGYKHEPEVTALDTGGWVVTWHDSDGQDGSSNGVFMQRYASDGSPAGTETQVNTYTNSTQYDASVTVLSNGDYVVTYASYNNTGAGGSGYDVFAQVFQADGTPVGTESLVNTEVASGQEMPSVTALASGGFAVSWESASSGSAGDGSGDGIFARIYGNAASGYAPVAAEFAVNDYTENAQQLPAIAMLNSGGFVITWESYGADGSTEGIFAQIFDAGGTEVGQEFRVNDERIGYQTAPDVTGLSNGGFVVTYISDDGYGNGVYAQQYDAAGNRIDGPVLVNTAIESNQDEASVAALDAGGFVVSYTSQTNGAAGDGDGNGIFYQVFTNTSPIVTNVSATTAEDVSLVLDAATFEAGFSDPEGDPMVAIRIDVLPSVGTLEYMGSPVTPGQEITVAELDAGALVYIPVPDFNGSADFGWTGTDGSGYANAIALSNITVTPVNDPVGLGPVPNQSIGEGSTLSQQLSFADPDGDTYAVTVNYGEGDADVSFNTTSHAPYLSNHYESEGVYTVTLSVDDGAGSVENTSFTVTVNNAAPNADNETYSTDEDTAVSGVNIFTGDSDPGGDPFTITEIDGVAYTPGDTVTLASGASVTVSASGDLVYDPSSSASLQALASGGSATDSFTYTIEDDGGLTDTAVVTVYVSGADDNVSAQDDAFATDEDSAVTGSVFADNGNGADTDPEGDTLTVVQVDGDALNVGAPRALSGGGVLQIDSDGSLSFNAAGQYEELGVGQTRDISFTYVVEESGSGLTASAQGTVTVTGVNDAPVADNETAFTNAGTPVEIFVLSGDYDPDQTDTPGLASLGTASNGSVSINDNATPGDTTDDSVIYTPDGGFSGSDSFTYTVSDGNGGVDTASVTVNVQGNTAPVANNDFAATTYQTPVTIDAGGNDIDADGDALSVTAAGPAGNGTVIIDDNGTPGDSSDDRIVYTPDTGFSGSDSFSYTVSDGTDSATATVSVSVAAPADVVSTFDTDTEGWTVTGDVTGLQWVATGGNPDGHIEATDLATGPYWFWVAPGAFLGDRSAYSGGSLTFDLSSSGGNGSANAAPDLLLTGGGLTIALDIGQADAAWTSFTTYLDTRSDWRVGTESGAVASQAQIDAVLADLQSIEIRGEYRSGVDVGTLDNVVLALPVPNVAPVATDDSATTDEDTATDISVLANDSDSDGGTLSVAAVSNGAHGTTAINPDGTITYTPVGNFAGSDSFTYTLSDGQGGTDTASVAITVTEVNDAPVAGNDSETVVEDGTLTGNVSGNDSDVDDASLSYTLLSGPSDGALTFNGDGSFSYSPDTDFAGSDSFTYQVSDGRGGTDTATVSITVTPENDAPVAVNDSYVLNEDVFSGANAAGGVLANDADADGDSLTVSLISDTSHGTLSLSPDGSFSYDPDPDFNGFDSFTYEVSDGSGGTDQATVSLQINPVNDAPVAVDDSFSTGFETALTIPAPGPLANDTDVDGDTLTVSSILPGANGTVSGVAADGTFTFTPDAGFSGTETLSYIVSDGTLTDTGTITIQVAPPVSAFSIADITIGEGDGTATFTITRTGDTSVASDQLTVGFTDGTALAGSDYTGGLFLPFTFAAGQTITTVSTGIIDDALVEGDESFFLELRAHSSGTLLATGQATITDNDIANDAPGLEAGLDETISEGETLTRTLSLTDTDTQTRSFTVDWGDGSAPESFDSGLTDPHIQHDYLDDGLYTVTVTVNDNAGAANSTETDSFAVTVGNLPPVAAADSGTVSEDGPAANLGSPLLNDTDPGFDTITMTGYAGISSSDAAFFDTPNLLPSGATITFTSSGDFVYDPNGAFETLAAGASATDSFTYTIEDEDGATDTGTVTVTINGENDAPVYADIPVTTAEDTAISVPFDNATDVDGDPLSYSVHSAPANGSVAVNALGEVIYTPDPDFNGTDSFDMLVEDGNGGSDTATVTVTVTPVNDAPDAVGDSGTAVTGTATRFDVLDNDGDPDGDTIGLIAVGTATNGTVVIDDNGTPGDASDDSLVYTATGGFTGIDSFTYTISDGALTDSATVTVTVGAAPVGIVGTPGNDRLTGTPEQDTISGLAGNDRIYGLASGDVIDGGADDDRIYGGEGNDTITGGTGNDVIYADLGGNREAGAIGADVLVFGMNDGADRVFDFAPGADRIQLIGPATAVFSYNPATQNTVMTYGLTRVTFYGANVSTADVLPVGNTPPDAANDAVETDAGTAVAIQVLGNDSDPDGDALSILSLAQPANGSAVIDDNGTPGDGSDDVIVYTPDAGFVGPDSFSYQVSDGNGGLAQATVDIAVGVVTITGTAGEDRLVGTQGRDVIDGLGEDDLLLGEGGNDAIAGGAGNDTARGGAGDDSIDGGGDNDRISGEDGDDDLLGGDGNDRVYGGEGNDTVTGGEGDDVLFGDLGGDRTAGATGADSFVFGTNDGRDQVFDFVSSVDQVILVGGGGYTLTHDGSDTLIEFGSSAIVFYDELLAHTDITMIV